MLRAEYPRPQLVRKEWECLNGEWDFRFDDEKEWGKIEVPFAYQAPLSGIGMNKMCDDMIYRREIVVPKEWKSNNIRLHFGAVDYRCKVFINGKFIGKHVGGNVGFSFDITECLNWDKEEILVYVNDPCKDESIPRGKQYWLPKQDSIWYTRTSGIWQSVWIEPLDEIYLKNVKYTGNIDTGNIVIEYESSQAVEDGEMRFQISMDNEVITEIHQIGIRKEGKAMASLYDNHIFRMPNHGDGWCWSPENPKLFEIEIKMISCGEEVDTVESYFGLRKIETRNGRVYLNNRPYYQKLVLDQGYWPEGILSAPSDEALRKDIEMAKNMGFNGCRKHQKCEEPRFLYWADKLGYIVWGEISASVVFTEKSAKRNIMEWTEVLSRDFNHPCIVAWVVLNESWGVPQISNNLKQQAHSMALYYHVKSLDETRLVVNNDGWEMTKTDICAIHNYNHGNSSEHEKKEWYREILVSKEKILSSEPAGRTLYAQSYEYRGEPIMLTEFGGVSYHKDEEEWGYTSVKNEEEFLETYERLMRVIRESVAIFGYCYTQLADVEQETNGLLTEDREYKISPDKIKKLNDLQIKNIL